MIPLRLEWWGGSTIILFVLGTMEVPFHACKLVSGKNELRAGAWGCAVNDPFSPVFAYVRLQTGDGW